MERLTGFPQYVFQVSAQDGLGGHAYPTYVWMSIQIAWDGEFGPGGTEASVPHMAETFKNELAVYLSEIFHIPVSYILTHASGFVEVENIATDSKRAFRNGIRIDTIDGHLLTTIMEEIQQSNSTVDMFDIMWKFTLDPSSVMAGGAPSSSGPLKLPYWAKKKDDYLWESYFYLDQPINCAVMAIQLYLRRDTDEILKVNRQKIGKKRNRSKKKVPSDILLKEAFELQQTLGWMDLEDGLLPIGRLAEYVDLHPEKRLVCLKSFKLKACHANTTWTGDRWNGSDENTIYIGLDIEQNHYVPVMKPETFAANIFGNGYAHSFCRRCLWTIRLGTERHICPVDESSKPKVIPAPVKFCPACRKYGDHECIYAICRTCSHFVKRGYEEPHRCLIWDDEEKLMKERFLMNSSYNDATLDGSCMKLWAYDIESAMMVEHFGTKTLDFEVDHGACLFPRNLKTTYLPPSKHVPVLIVFKDVFSDESPKHFKGSDALERFLDFMLTHNGGNNICAAHNASGYDAQLIFDVASKQFSSQIQMTTVLRGCKFLRMNIGKTLFIDSMLHIRGSLKSLAIDFLGKDANIRKGFFPHVFHTVDHENYIGPLPEKRYFNSAFSFKNASEFDEFTKWHEEASNMNGDRWNLAEELLAYCRNDVDILARVMRKYHDELFTAFGMSPWFKSTSPSFVHSLFMRKISLRLELPPAENKMLRISEMNRLAIHEHWAALLPEEFHFARNAMRGGRTEIRRCSYELSEQDRGNGIEIIYQDVVSLYPFVQIEEEYPVGTPIIRVYDERYYPCHEHRNLPGNCGCPLSQRKWFLDSRLRVEDRLGARLTEDMILADPDFFGIVCASVTPNPNLWHPVLVHYDESAQKCVASLEQIKEGYFTSVEFKHALKRGYRLDRLHRVDIYRHKPSLWAEDMKRMYLEKLANSGPAPADEAARARLCEVYQNRFGMGKMLEESFHRWGKNPARKQTYKILINSCWGKHGQRPIMPTTEIMNVNDVDLMKNLFSNLTAGNYSYMGNTPLSDQTALFKYMENGKHMDPNLHKQYYPAALFVPAYGRLTLLKGLEKLGNRVLMHDTDSIIYISYKPEDRLPKGSVLGDWEEEDFGPRHGGIVGFAGMGPKTYALKAADGEEVVKCKGVAIKYAMRNHLNYSTMMESIWNQTILRVPQMEMPYKLGQGKRTTFSFKEIKFDPQELKGDLQPDFSVAPFGFEGFGCHGSNYEIVDE